MQKGKMTKSESAMLGWIASKDIREKLYQKRIDDYNSNPSICGFCKKPLPYEKRKLKYCNSSCSASYTNRRRESHGILEGKCKRCDCPIKYRKNNHGYVKIKYCDKCRCLAKSEKMAGKYIANMTKGELRKRYKNYTGYRSAISHHACIVCDRNGIERKCKECGYDKWVDMCHVKPVADFPDSALISEINSLENILPLCKNHHWEFDHGLLNIGITPG